MNIEKPTIENIKDYIVAELIAAREDEDRNYIQPETVAENVFHLLDRKYVLNEKNSELSKQCKAKDKWINELLLEVEKLEGNLL